MAFRYSCFISYGHGQGDLMRRFVEELKEALEASLGPLLEEGVFIDEDRLRPGYLYNDVLASAICQSLCMVVVYSPIYERHPYCLREYRAMELLQEERLRLLGGTLGRGVGLIIPILLRGRLEDLPDKIKGHIHFCDFSKFTMASPKIRRKQEYVDKIENIAQYVYDLHRGFAQIETDLCRDCHTFNLPATLEVAPWRLAQGTAEPKLPLR